MHSTKRSIRLPLESSQFRRLAVAGGVCALAFVCLALRYAGDATALYRIWEGAPYARTGGVPSFIVLVMTQAPILVFCYLFSDFLKQHVRHAVPIFTRTANRSLWFAKAATHLCGFGLAFAALEALMVLAVSFIMADGDAEAMPNLASFLPNAALRALSLLVLLVPLAALSARFNSLISFAALAGFYAATLALCATLPEWLAFVLPPAQGVFALHEVPPLFGGNEQGAIDGFTLPYSYAYLLFALCLELGISTACARRLELF